MHTITMDDLLRLADDSKQLIASKLKLAPGREADFFALFKDPEAVDVILDDPRLFSALTAGEDEARLDTHLSCFIAIRYCLLRVGIEDREVAEYLAHMLAEYAQAPTHDGAAGGDRAETAYLVELMRAMQHGSREHRFLIRTHIANYALYMTGLFPERLQYRSKRRGAPDYHYYLELGHSTYLAAARDRLAWEFGLDRVFASLAAHFRQARQALAILAEHRLYDGGPCINHAALLAEAV